LGGHTAHRILFRRRRATCGNAAPDEAVEIDERLRGARALIGSANALARLRAWRSPAPSYQPFVGRASCTVCLDRRERRQRRLVDGAVKHGANVVLGGKRIDRVGSYMQPTILTDIMFRQELRDRDAHVMCRRSHSRHVA
jgi:hypothetical protein